MAEDIKPEGEMGEGSGKYAGLGREDEPQTREQDPVKAEHMGHAMDPHIEDASQLDAMAAKARADRDKTDLESSGMKAAGLLEKEGSLKDAANSSRFVAGEAAEEAGKAYDEAQKAQEKLNEIS